MTARPDTIKGGIYFWPRELNFTSYKEILTDHEILHAVGVTVARTVIGTPLTVIVISLLAYPLSNRELVARRPVTLYFIFTMYFGGGLIPYYMVLKNLQLINWSGCSSCLA